MKNGQYCVIDYYNIFYPLFVLSERGKNLTSSDSRAVLPPNPGR